MPYVENVQNKLDENSIYISSNDRVIGKLIFSSKSRQFQFLQIAP